MPYVARCRPIARSLCDTYSVLDIDKPNVPHLASEQRRRLRRIEATPAYAKRWEHLRFWAAPAARVPRRLALVVFDDRGEAQRGLGRMYDIIGIPCGMAFNPTEGGTEALPAEACSGPTSQPVRR